MNAPTACGCLKPQIQEIFVAKKEREDVVSKSLQLLIRDVL
jgi:hypothetical protein